MRMTVSRTEVEPDRVLLFGHEKYDDYYVIASVKDDVGTGDFIEYEPDGWNFGWFKRKLS